MIIVFVNSFKYVNTFNFEVVRQSRFICSKKTIYISSYMWESFSFCKAECNIMSYIS